MANALYEFGKAEFLRANIDLDAATKIGVALIGETNGTNPYVFDAADQDWADVTAHTDAVVQDNNDTDNAFNQLQNKTVSNTGVFDADDYTFGAVTGNQIDSIIIYYDTGVAATSTLIAYIDTATGLTAGLTPNGGDITIAWDSGGNGIFKL